MLASSAEYCFGIDLGTSNSSICYINPKGRHPLPYVHVEAVRIPRDDAGDYSHRLPSVLFAGGKQVVAGFEAQAKWKKGRLWETLFPSAKSELGAHRFYEQAANPKLDTPVKVQAELLRRLISAAKERTGEDPCQSRVVITVPASFEMGQRKDTLEAARLAGLTLGDGDLLDEPNAAFLDLANSQAIDRLDLSSPKNILVFDFGGGTCDLSLLRVQRDNKKAPLALLIENLAISNYSRLGGDNLDLLLVHEVLLPKVCQAGGLQFENLSERDKRDLRWHLKETACLLKERLCDKAREAQKTGKPGILKQVWAVETFTLSDAGVTTKKARGELTYAEFETLLQPLVDRSSSRQLNLADGYFMGSIFGPVREALEKAALPPDQVDAVLLNGGSCRNPLVVRAFRESGFLPQAQILDQGDLDLAVARGAAVRCYYQHCQDYDPITPIVSTELGLITHGDHYAPLVAARERLPFPSKGKFKKFEDHFSVPKAGLSRIQLPIYSGKAGNRHVVQTMTLAVPEQAADGERVVVELKIDLNKIMRFRAYLPAHPGIKLDVTLENPLATRSLNPEQQAALEQRRQLSARRLADPAYQPSVAEWLALAKLEWQAAEPERALEILQRLQARLKQQDQSLPAEGHNLFGLIYGRLGRRDLSHEHYLRALELEPANGHYAANCGFALIHLGRPEEAIGYLQRAVAADPAAGQAYVILGDALRHAGREDEAVKVFHEGKQRLEQQLEQSPGNTYLLSWAESVCQRLGESEAMNAFNQRKQESARQARLGASPDELVATRTKTGAVS